MEAKTDSNNYKRIADAIRRKNGSEDRYYPSEMPDAIDAIRTEPIVVDDDLNPESENPVQNRAIVEGISEALEAANTYTDEAVQAMDDEKQNTLVSGENIKTVNNQTLLGDGNIVIGAEGTIPIDSSLRPSSENAVQNKVIWHSLEGKQPRLVSGGNIKTFNGESILGAGDLTTPDTYLESVSIDTDTVPGTLSISEITNPHTYENNILTLGTVPGSTTAHVVYPYAFFNNKKVSFESFTGDQGRNYIILAQTTKGFIFTTLQGGLYYVNNTGLGSNSEATKNLNTTINIEIPATVELLNDSTLKINDLTVTKATLTGALKSYDTITKLIIGYSIDFRSQHNAGTSATIGITTAEAKVLKFTLNNGNDVLLNIDEIAPEPVEERKPLEGMKLSILGDSISTFSGYIPTGYTNYYPRWGLSDVNQTWWKMLMNETGLELLVNASSGGTSVCGNSSSTTDAAAGCSTKRVNDLSDGSENPDIVICFIGINDFSHRYTESINWTYKPLGDYIGVTSIPEDSTNVDEFGKAYGLMLYKIMSKYKSSKVYACSILETTHVQKEASAGFPANNGGGFTVSQYNARIKTLCENLGANFIDLHSCGINYWNLSDFTGDGLHPNPSGAVLIKERVKAALLNDIK